MPLYMSKRRDTGEVRHFEAPTNRTVLLHLAEEMFEVALVKIERIGEVAPPLPSTAETVEAVKGISAELPARRRGRPPKNPPPAPAAEPTATQAESEAAERQPPAPNAPAASDALIEEEAARAKSLFERMSDIARNATPAPANNAPDGVGEGEAVPLASPETTHDAMDAEVLAAAEEEMGEDEQPARPEPMF